MYEDPFASGVSKGSHRIGVLGEYDLKHVGWAIPVGFSLGYTQAIPDDDPYGGMSGAVFGIWYTGKADFEIGLETSSMKIPADSQESGEVRTGFGLLTIRYFF